jgi:hypothetical protein
MQTTQTIQLTKSGALLLLLLSTLIHQPSTASAQGTAFTYQGRLAVDGNTSNGVFDFTFTLFGASSGGSAIAGPVTNSAVGVTNGLFTTTLDLGANFPGADRWLEIGVRSNGVGAFVMLSPRQAVTPSPYAIHAAGVSAAGITGTITPANIGAGTITGTMLAAGSITSNNLAAGSVTSHSLSDGTVGLEKLDTVPVPPGSVTLVAPTPASFDFFGTSVASLGSDRVLVGAVGAGSSGGAYLFNTNGTLLTTFTHPTSTDNIGFGASVAAAGDNAVLIGAGIPLDTLGTTNAYLFTTNGTVIMTFTNPTGVNEDYFGAVVAGVGTDKVLIGAQDNDTGADRSGAAYLFSTNGALLATYTNRRE